MDANCSAEMVSFGQQHFGNCDLGDIRRTSRLVKTTDLFLQHPGGTLPDKLNRNADLIGFYRMANNENVRRSSANLPSSAKENLEVLSQFKDREDAQGDRLLNNLQLKGGELAVADAVGWDLEAIFSEGDQPADNDGEEQGRLPIFQVAVPGGGHE